MPKQESRIKIITLRIPEELHRRMKIAVASDNISMQKALMKGLRAYLEDFKKRRKACKK